MTPGEVLKLDIELDGLPLDEQDLQLIENKIYVNVLLSKSMMIVYFTLKNKPAKWSK